MGVSSSHNRGGQGFTIVGVGAACPVATAVDHCLLCDNDDKQYSYDLSILHLNPGVENREYLYQNHEFEDGHREFVWLHTTWDEVGISYNFVEVQPRGAVLDLLECLRTQLNITRLRATVGNHWFYDYEIEAELTWDPDRTTRLELYFTDENSEIHELTIRHTSGSSQPRDPPMDYSGYGTASLVKSLRAAVIT